MARKEGLRLQAGEPEFEAKSYDELTELDGLSPELMDDHIGLYRGYVKNANRAHGLLREGDLDTFERSEVRRRFGWEFNGMRLHEMYFDALTPGGKDLDEDTKLHEGLTKDFGSLAAWAQDFRAVGSMRGIGWAALCHDPVTDRFFNTWVDEHDAGNLVGTTPVLLMDVFEHAFIKDFGTDRDLYMDAYFQNVDWTVADKRL